MATELLEYTIDPPAPEPGVFEFGLVLAGAISAGAYTAGVLDFLIEALDAWEAAKEAARQSQADPREWAVPSHSVRLRVVSGASAGSMTGAMAGIALNYDFSHVRPGSTPPRGNPLYEAWVRQIDIVRLLETRDLAASGARVVSLLDSTVLTEILNSTLSFSGPPRPQPRPYLGSAVRFVFTQANLRGVPYFVNFRGNSPDEGLAMIAHSDYQSFSVRYAAERAQKRPDDVSVDFPNSPRVATWRAFCEAALSSGAFPVGLAPSPIERDGRLYDHRYLAVPTEDGKGEIRQLLPRWGAGGTPRRYDSIIVDGGTLNNEPIELARTEMAGLTGRNLRSGHDANRAVVLVDPFPDKAAAVDDAARGQKKDLLAVVPALIKSLIDQARFAPAALALAQDKDVYSRFLIAPSRDKDPDSAGFSLACGALGGFSGFLCEAFRHHDYLLGRRNCQQFLREHFALPPTNPLFAQVNPALARAGSPYLTRGELPHLPIIPLVGALQNQEPLQRWPRDDFDIEHLDGVGSRFDAIVDRYLSAVDAPWRWLARPLRWPLRSWVADRVRNEVVAQLSARRLVRGR